MSAFPSRFSRSTIAAALFVSSALIAGCGGTSSPDTIAPNDGQKSAGTMSGNVLTVALETRIGHWQPDGDGGNRIDSIAAFAEVGHSPSTPGPMIRVPVGTTVKGTFHNTLGYPLTLFGLGKARGTKDSVIVAAGATSPFEFQASQAGTFYYAAFGKPFAFGFRDPTEQQLVGAIVVDRPGAPKDRVMAITWHGVVDTTSPNGIDRTAMTINGRSWPHTEHLTYAEGDSVHWRVINFTELDHPMHLHGFYFRVNERTVDATDSLYTADQQRMAVTEVVEPFTAVEIAWKAERPGNWVFHCHYAVHIGNLVSMDMKKGVYDAKAQEHHPSDMPHHMAGLVMGVTVTPSGPEKIAGEPDRKIRIEQREKPNVYGKQPGMSYVMNDTKEAADPAAMPVPGPALILERGKRIQVTIVNRTTAHAAVHWHGIEIENYPDGVPGVSGYGKQILPMIAPNDSLAVRWVPPRAGSFMYHSHINEAQQMGSGLYGPIIVLEPGEKFNAETDRIFFFGTAGMLTSVAAPPPALLLNGAAHPAPMDLKVGTHYRFRFFNLAGDSPTFVSVTRGGKPAEWKALAKDGYALPTVQAVRKTSTLMFDPGEIYDFEFTPDHSGDFALNFGPPQPPPGAQGPPVPPLVAVAMHAR